MSMKQPILEVFINFDGNCREAVEFYAKVFRTEIGNLMTFADQPADPDHPISEESKNRILYAGVPVGDVVMMFSDVPAGVPLVQGGNVATVLNYDDKDEVARVYHELLEGGSAIMELGPTFFSELFAMLKDKFGILWQISYYVKEETA